MLYHPFYHVSCLGPCFKRFCPESTRTVKWFPRWNSQVKLSSDWFNWWTLKSCKWAAVRVRPEMKVAETPVFSLYLYNISAEVSWSKSQSPPTVIPAETALGREPVSFHQLHCSRNLLPRCKPTHQVRCYQGMRHLVFSMALRGLGRVGLAGGESSR